MNKKTKKLFPVGYKYQYEVIFCVLAIIVAVLFSLQFFIEYKAEYYDLFEYYGDKTVLKSFAFMPDYYILILDCFKLFSLLPFVFAYCCIANYTYHYKHSKSIYLMKRLPQKSELYVRCVAFPLICLVLSVLVLIALIFIYYAYYMLKTPAECLQPSQLQKLFDSWRCFF